MKIVNLTREEKAEAKSYILHTFACEDMYASEQDLKNIDSVLNNEKPIEEIIAEEKQRLKKEGIKIKYKKLIKDPNKFREAERRLTMIRFAETVKYSIQEDFSDLHNPYFEWDYFNWTYFAIHPEYMYKDIYPLNWKFREKDIATNNQSNICPRELLDDNFKYFFEQLKRDDNLQNLSLENIAELASDYYLELSYLNPSQHGNGIMIRHFMKELLKSNGYDLILDNIQPNDLKQGVENALINKNPSYFKSLMRNSIKAMSNYPKYNLPEKDDQTQQDELNNFLWIYDREHLVGWSTNNQEVCQNKLSQALETTAGKEQIKKILDSIIKREESILDGTADYRKEIIKEAQKYKVKIDFDLMIDAEPVANKLEEEYILAHYQAEQFSSCEFQANGKKGDCIFRDRDLCPADYDKKQLFSPENCGHRPPKNPEERWKTIREDWQKNLPKGFDNVDEFFQFLNDSEARRDKEIAQMKSGKKQLNIQKKTQFNIEELNPKTSINSINQYLKEVNTKEKNKKETIKEVALSK